MPDGVKLKSKEKNISSTSLSTINPTWTALWLNSGIQPPQLWYNSRRYVCSIQLLGIKYTELCVSNTRPPHITVGILILITLLKTFFLGITARGGL